MDLVTTPCEWEERTKIYMCAKTFTLMTVLI